MKVFFSLIKKEAVEGIRTKKVLILMVLLLFIALISPLTAKLMPLIMDSLSTEEIQIKVPDPTEIDSWVQFFKNTSDIGMIGLMILFSTQMSNELKKGTLINLLSKGLPRFQVILSKFVFDLILWSISYSICFLCAFGYTRYYFDSIYPMEHILMAALLPMIYGVFLIALELLAGVVTGNVIGTLAFVAGGVFLQSLLSLKEEIAAYMPSELMVKPIAVIKGTDMDNYFLPIIITCGMIVICISISIYIFNRKQIL